MASGKKNTESLIDYYGIIITNKKNPNYYFDRLSLAFMTA